jgi:tRNA A37 methylthiotransferase MiaB
MPGRPRISIYTLGCKANRYDSDSLARRLRQKGYIIALPGEPADTFIVNTCTVTSIADAKTRKLIRRLAAKFAGAPIVATGCAAQVDGDELARLPGVCAVIPNTEKDGLPDRVERLIPVAALPETCAAACLTPDYLRVVAEGGPELVNALGRARIIGVMGGRAFAQVAA